MKYLNRDFLIRSGSAFEFGKALSGAKKKCFLAKNVWKKRMHVLSHVNYGRNIAFNEKVYF